MKLTSKLIGYLNRVWNKSPQSFLALKLDYVGPMTWAVADQVLTTTVQGGVGVNLSIDLTQYTLGQLVTFLGAQAGYVVQQSSVPDYGLSACVLLNATGDPSLPNGDSIFGYRSLAWAIVDSMAVELHTAGQQVAAAPQMMQTTTGQGAWLDVIGGLYGVPRNFNELNPAYGPRIITQVLQPTGNNFAIALILERLTGYKYDVPDANAGVEALFFDGKVDFTGAPIFYNSTAGSLALMFDVVVHTGAGLSAAAFDALVATITPVINAVRAGGTGLRNVSQTA